MSSLRTQDIALTLQKTINEIIKFSSVHYLGSNINRHNNMLYCMHEYILLVILTIKYRVSNRNIKSLWEFNKGATSQMAGWRKRVKLSRKYIQ